MAAARLVAGGRRTRFLLPVAPSLDRAWIESFLQGSQARFQLCDDALIAVGAADAAAVCSGTATLETALIGTPQVVGYRTNPTNWRLIKLLVNLNHASIVNILAGREVLPELLQDDLQAEALADRLAALLDDERLRQAMQRDCAAIRAELGAERASERAADAVLSLVDGRLRQAASGV